ncbi:MAG: TolB family protein [Alphaproteobacteria bacterium]|nr:TolB family protein [Alphaproteobacteria bacterium]
MRSELCLFDITTNAVTPVLETSQLIEAPNWTQDGKALIINGDGLIYRVDLETRVPVQIDTGFATACNNDHGISPDGTQLVISDGRRMGSSTIYILPITGGVPRQVTEKSPSYWHGWSPDGRHLAYVAKRGGNYQVFTIAVEGGPEQQITDDFSHCDGPDYTPDGKWIWFNGEKGGSVQLWRMHPDGTNLQQMTSDERVNWFPHPSPDGKHVLYLAYENGTNGHPRDKDVQLRLMPAGGGAPRVLLDLFGGQGSINVPCWAPDGRRFAFMRYHA